MKASCISFKWTTSHVLTLEASHDSCIKDQLQNLISHPWLGIQRHQNIETAIVCHIFDEKGEVAAGVAHVESIVSWFKNKQLKVNSHCYLLLMCVKCL